MRHSRPFFAGFMVWIVASAATAQPAAAPQPNPLRDAAIVRTQNLPPAASSPSADVDIPKPAAGPAEPVVIDARLGEHADRTRFVVELSDPVKFHIFTLSDPRPLGHRHAGGAVADEGPAGAKRVGRRPQLSLWPVPPREFSLRHRSQPPRKDGRADGPAAAGRLWLPPRARPVPDHPGGVRQEGRLAGRSEGPRRSGGRHGIAAAGRTCHCPARPPVPNGSQAARSWSSIRAMAASIPEPSA